MTTKDRLLWAAIVGAPTAWFVDHVAKWMVTPGAYQTGSRAALRGLSAGTLAIAVVATVIGAVCLRELPHVALEGAEHVTARRRRFLAISALVLGLGSALLILGNAIPTFLLEPGQEP